MILCFYIDKSYCCHSVTKNLQYFCFPGDVAASTMDCAAIMYLCYCPSIADATCDQVLSILSYFSSETERLFSFFFFFLEFLVDF